MKYLNEFAKRKIFTFNDFSNYVGDSNLAKVTIQNYLKKGLIKRIKQNLYVTISLETNECLADKFLIGSKITDSAFISHHSAFEYYGYYNQVYNQVNVSSIAKFNDFEFGGNEYSLIKVNSNILVDEIRGVRVSSIERTIVDSIKDYRKYSDLEETLNCINQIPYISIDDILYYLEFIGSKLLYKKVGIVLSLFKEKLNIPDSFFEKCNSISNTVKGYFDNNKDLLVYNSKWKMYVYKDLANYINKEWYLCSTMVGMR